MAHTPAQKPMTHRDEVHGDVKFDRMARELLNLPQLQRLGRVYQLGYSHLVYRGGTHTRLSHVMGAYHVAGELVKSLRDNYDGVLPVGAEPVDDFLPVVKANPDYHSRWSVLEYLVKWAGLLHDMGHVPLGHTLEDEFTGIYANHDDFASPRMRALWHEWEGQESPVRKLLMNKAYYPVVMQGLSAEYVWQTVMLICLYKEKVVLNERTPFKTILQMARVALEAQIKDGEPMDASLAFLDVVAQALERAEGEGLFHPYMTDIVANTICADYLDYTRRDPRNLGIDVLEDPRVTNSFYVGKDNNGHYRMALTLVNNKGKKKPDVCTGVLELVGQRYRYAEIVYYHKTKAAASTMLARVFTLIGKPTEVRRSAEAIHIDNINMLAQSLLLDTKVAQESQSVFALEREQYPSALLDPEIGDESLAFLLMNRSWDALKVAVSAKDEKGTKNSLRAISMLQALSRRSLFKVCLAIDKEVFHSLCGHHLDDAHADGEILDLIAKLRVPSSPLREEIELGMRTAAGSDGEPWPEDAFLFYVPERKSQAKGINTGALDHGKVITLGTHQAVKAEVKRLGEKYRDLWRILVFVHPDYATRHLELSRAMDSFVKHILPAAAKTDVVHNVPAMKDAAWFPYVNANMRLGMAFRQQVRNKNDVPMDKADKVLATFAGDTDMREFGTRLVLFEELEKSGLNEEKALALIKSNFPTGGALDQRVEKEMREVAVEGFQGADDPLWKYAAILSIVAGVKGEGEQQKLL